MITKTLVEYILENPKVSNRQLEKIFNINRKKISEIKRGLNIDQLSRKVTSEEREFIIENAFKKTSDEISKEIGVAASTIRGIWQEASIDKRMYFTPVRYEFIDMYDYFKSSRILAEYYGCDRVTILNYASKINYINESAKLRLINEEDISNIRSQYNFESATTLAQSYKCSKSRIAQVWSNSGHKGKVNRTYYSNFNYFENIDSRDKAYILGFIAADGCVYSRSNDKQQDMLSIRLSSKDISVLNVIKKYTASSNPIINYKYVNENGTEIDTVQLQIVSDVLCGDLAKYNILPRKTWAYSPSSVPFEFIWHFIRGYFDGDGSISSSKREYQKPSSYTVSFVGNRNTMSFLQSVLSYYGIKASLIRDKRDYTNDFYYLNITSASSKYKFLKLLYKDCQDLFLKRKKDVSDKFI